MAEPEALFLALDQGGGSSRAAIFDVRGECLASFAVAVTTRHPSPGRVEQSPEALVESLRQAAAQTLAQLPPGLRVKVKRFGLACQRASLIAWDRLSGEPLTPVISWQDVRGASPFHPSPEQRFQLQQLTGLYPSAHHGASKFRWCLDNLPKVQAAAKKGSLCLSPLAGYLMAALTGFARPAAVDPASAQRTLLWGQREKDWQPELLRNFNLKRRWLPALAPCIGDWGRASFAGTELQGGFLGGDQGAALYASGRPDPDALVNLGTGGFVLAPLHAPHPSPAPLQQSLLLTCSNDANWALEGTIHGCGAALEWLRRYAPVGFDDRDLAHWLREVTQPALFLNAVGGLGSPDWRSDLQSRFVGPASFPARAAGLLESIVFLVVRNLDVLQKKHPVHQLRLTGGLGALPGLGQRLADLSGLPVLRPLEREATLRGVGYLLAGCPDGWRGASAERIEPVANASLLRRYRRWQTCMERLLSHP
ncbi:FGGY family carbohydrate kinase [Motiliproteus sp. SC1-56]|uniref:FGGY family carbohydrate kinase n=1 Tax=Motiliproteus sp. SC1-56 TaxID=2799565 RepID=UPI001A8C66DF|nr:FGGY family carbohydrate kinase [Motiliproteus sp. SC1-56]